MEVSVPGKLQDSSISTLVLLFSLFLLSFFVFVTFLVFVFPNGYIFKVLPLAWAMPWDYYGCAMGTLCLFLSGFQIFSFIWNHTSRTQMLWPPKGRRKPNLKVGRHARLLFHACRYGDDEKKPLKAFSPFLHTLWILPDFGKVVCKQSVLWGSVLPWYLLSPGGKCTGLIALVNPSLYWCFCT